MTAGLQPTPWLVDHAHVLPMAGDALDVAAGRGRNALWLAERGFTTRAIDRDAAAIAELTAVARRRQLPLRAEVVDLEEGRPARLRAPRSGEVSPKPWRRREGRPLPESEFDLIVVVQYLHRPLFPAL